MASTGTIDYLDPQGTKKTGAYKDGVTYTDDTYSSEVPVGSVVNTAGGLYQKTNTGSVKAGTSDQFSDYQNYLQSHPYSSSSSGSGDYSSYINEMYQAKQDAALAALEAAYDKNVAELDAQEDEIPATYQTARNQTAASGEQSKRNFAEYAAANGLNSGAGGQAELSRSVALQGSLNSLSEAQADALSDLALQRTQLETDYNSAIAAARADGDYELASALYQEKARRQESATAERQYQDSLALQLASYNDQKAQDALARQDTEYNRNLQLAQLLGSAGSFDRYRQLYGLTDAEIAALKKWYRQYGQ